MAYHLNKEGRSGGLGAGCARPQTPTPQVFEKILNGFSFYVQVSHGFGAKKGRRQNSGDGCLKKWMNFLDLTITINGIL